MINPGFVYKCMEDVGKNVAFRVERWRKRPKICQVSKDQAGYPYEE